MQLGIESKQMSREPPFQAPLNASQSSASNPLNDTLEEIKVVKQPNEVAIISQPQRQPFKKDPSERVSK